MGEWVYKVKREGAVGRVESVEAYHGGGREKSQDRRRAAASLKRDGRMTMARGLYRKRGGGVVAAGNDLDRQTFTGIVKECGFNSVFLSGTFGFCPYRLSRCTILDRAVPPPLSPYPYLSRAPLSIKMYHSFIRCE